MRPLTFTIVTVLAWSAQSQTPSSLPDPPPQSTWSCDYDTTFNKGEWAINIIPWYGVRDNIYSKDDFLRAHAMIYSESTSLAGGCNVKDISLVCISPSDFYTITTQGLDIESDVQLSMGAGCIEKPDPKMGLFSRRFYGGPTDFPGAEIKLVGKNVTVDIKAELHKLHRGEDKSDVSNDRLCRLWKSNEGPYRNGVLCRIPHQINGTL